MASSKRWTHDELLIALNLYHKLTFGQLHARQPVIVSAAKQLGRSANSLAMKLCNLASLDPALKLRGVKGLTGASALDRSAWQGFHENLEEAVATSEQALRNLYHADAIEVSAKKGIRIQRPAPDGPTEIVASVWARRGQDYFRDAVLNNFGERCGVTQLGLRELLIASHILPWGQSPEERLNVKNGLCLSRLHDAAFDRWLISFDDQTRLMLSPRLKAEMPLHIVKESFGAYEGQPLKLPDDAIPPDPAFLAQHRRIFQAQAARN